jgi:hypothetical protein
MAPRIASGVISEDGIPIASPTATPTRHPYACLKSLLSAISIIATTPFQCISTDCT